MSRIEDAIARLRECAQHWGRAGNHFDALIMVAMCDVIEAAYDLEYSVRPKGPVLTDNNPYPKPVKRSLDAALKALLVLSDAVLGDEK